MASIKRYSSETVTIFSQPADRLKVWHLLDFADAVRAAGIPDEVDVIATKANDTQHTTGLRLGFSWPREPSDGLGGDEKPDPPADPPDGS